MWPTRKNRQDQGALDGAIRAWRQQAGAAADAPRLSDAARDRILREACETTGAPASFGELFVPKGRLLALAGAVPLALAMAIVAWIGGESGGERSATTPAVPGRPVHATKSGDEVIFLIANGQRAHAVYKSNHPDRFDSPPAFWTEDGTFRDSLTSGPDLVFYRID